MLAQSPTVASVLSSHDRFYPVVYGRHPGVYLSWENAELEVTGCDIRIFQHVKTFADSLVFMIMKGAYHTVNDLPVLGLPSSSVQMLSPKREFPSLKTFGGKVHDASTSATDLNLSSAMHNMSIVQTVDQSSNRGSSSRSLPPARSSPRPPPWIHHRVRTLAGVVGSVPVTDDIERYLQAHGYKVSAVWSIIHAFKDAFGPDDFMAYVCPKGMPVLEAAYIYELISGRDQQSANLFAPSFCFHFNTIFQSAVVFVIPMPEKSHSSDFHYQKTMKSSYRTPWRHQLKRKQVQRSAAEKRAMKEKRLACKTEYADAMKLFYKTHAQRASGEAKITGMPTCVVNSKNAMMPRLKASEIAPELSKEWKFMSKEDKENVTKDYMDDLEEYRANKSLAVHNVAINSFHDVRRTLDLISVQLSELAARTGEAIFLVTVHGDCDHLARPFIYMSEDKLADHFVMLTRLTPHKFATRLEACVISGVTGLVSNYKESYLTLKRELTSLILGKLNQAAQVPIPKMFYNNFDTQITAKHGIAIENWPLKNFVSPSDIGSTTELRVLHNALKMGVTTF
ncbi:hypothetical protein EV424DRAFT_1546419 [Suillus variegatus]|nr:hypothetical protein EV424DRAFT_1546419 [Suillus variegatus]